MKKHFFQKTVILGLFILINPFTSQAIVPPSYWDFPDVPKTHPNYEAITYFKNKSIIKGYSDGLFKPDKTVNRVEALKIIFDGLAIPDPRNPVTPTKYPDIDVEAWYMPFVTKAFTMGVASGYPDGTFRPEQTINLVESVRMSLTAANRGYPDLVNVSKTSIGDQKPYNDVGLTEWYTQDMTYVKNHDLIKADSQNNVYPAQPMSRAKFVELIYQIRKFMNMVEGQNLTGCLKTVDVQGISMNYPCDFPAPATPASSKVVMSFYKGQIYTAEHDSDGGPNDVQQFTLEQHPSPVTQTQLIEFGLGSGIQTAPPQDTTVSGYPAVLYTEHGEGMFGDVVTSYYVVSRDDAIYLFSLTARHPSESVRKEYAAQLKSMLDSVKLPDEE